jgi:hypothetical protein
MVEKCIFCGAMLEETRFCQKNKKSVQKSARKNQAGRGGPRPA